MRLPALAAALALAAAPALAHDIWVVPVQSEGKTVAHIRYADPARRELAERGKVVALEVITAAGRTNLKRPLTPAKTGGPALESAPFEAHGPAILAVTYDNGFWTVDAADGVESNTPKPMVKQPKESWWVPKYGKTLLGPGSHTLRMGASVELMPLADPWTLSPGATLPVRLEREGKPVAGEKVVYGDGIEPVPEDKMPSLVTGPDGIVRIPISRRGPYLITNHHVGPPTFPAMADNDDAFTSLAFDTTPKAQP